MCVALKAYFIFNEELHTIGKSFPTIIMGINVTTIEKVQLINYWSGMNKNNVAYFVFVSFNFLIFVEIF